MPDKRDSMKKVIDTLEALRGQELDPEEYGEIDEWNKGRALTQLVVMPGWSVVLEMLASYAAGSMQKLSNMDPKHKDEVAAEHAIFYAANRIYNNFVQDVANAVDKSRRTPSVVKDGLRRASPAPPDMMG